MGVSIGWEKVSMLSVGGSEWGLDVIDGDGWVAMATGGQGRATVWQYPC